MVPTWLPAALASSIFVARNRSKRIRLRPAVSSPRPRSWSSHLVTGSHQGAAGNVHRVPVLGVLRASGPRGRGTRERMRSLVVAPRPAPARQTWDTVTNES